MCLLISLQHFSNISDKSWILKIIDHVLYATHSLRNVQCKLVFRSWIYKCFFDMCLWVVNNFYIITMPPSAADLFANLLIHPLLTKNFPEVIDVIHSPDREDWVCSSKCFQLLILAEIFRACNLFRNGNKKKCIADTDHSNIFIAWASLSAHYANVQKIVIYFFKRRFFNSHFLYSRRLYKDGSSIKLNLLLNEDASRFFKNSLWNTGCCSCIQGRKQRWCDQRSL